VSKVVAKGPNQRLVTLMAANGFVWS